MEVFTQFIPTCRGTLLLRVSLTLTSSLKAHWKAKGERGILKEADLARLREQLTSSGHVGSDHCGEHLCDCPVCSMLLLLAAPDDARSAVL